MTWLRGPMHRFVCDYKPTGDYVGPGHCAAGEGARAAEFRSASVLSVLADQLRRAGWSIIVITGKGPHDWRDVIKLTGTDHARVHLCPAHRPQIIGRMSAMRT